MSDRVQHAWVSPCQEPLYARGSAGAMSRSGHSKSIVVKLFVAEGVGFEPTVRLPPQRFSRPSDSAALAPLLEYSGAVRLQVPAIGEEA